MAKLKDDAITKSDLIEYLDGQSDFAFELRVLNNLVPKRFECEHGGTYEDPVTKKLRQFDLRAVRKFGYVRLHLAIECKQLRDNYPLLVLRMPRRQEESFHELLLVVDPDRCPIGDDQPMVSGLEQTAISIPIRTGSLYPQGEPVGKTCAQVGRDNAGITGSDSELFGKWTQAINSAQGMIDQACDDTPTDREGWILSLVLPIVVVPDQRLWVVDYSADGTRTSAPTQVDRCSYLVSATCLAGDRIRGTNYTLSHLEFTTVTGLDQLIDSLGSNDGPNPRFFPAQNVRRYFRH